MMTPPHPARSARLLTVILLLPLLGLTPDPEGRALRILSSRPWNEGGEGGRLLLLEPPPLAVNALPGETDEQVLEKVRRLQAGEFEFFEITGVRLEGHVSWCKGMRLVRGDEESIMGIAPASPLSDPSRRILEFYRSESWNDCQQLARTATPRHRGEMTVDGILCDYGLWRFDDPEFGPVTYVLGRPRNGGKSSEG